MIGLPIESEIIAGHPLLFKGSLDKGVVMRKNTSSPGASRDSSHDPLFETIESVVLSLPHAQELAQLEVSETASQAIVPSGNILPFRRNRLRPEEKKRLLNALAD